MPRQPNQNTVRISFRHVMNIKRLFHTHTIATLRDPSSTMLARCSLVSSTFLRSAVPRGIRSFSVIHLSDEAAVEKFHTVNNKSVLYFTANWCGRE